MKVHLYKSGESLTIGIKYCKDLFIDGEHVLTFSFLHTDLEIEW